MKVTREWLQHYFDKELPPVEELSDALTFHAFEIDEIKGDMLDVKVLPNRAADCLSHNGIAKELSAILDIPLKYDPLREALPAFPTTEEVRIEIADPKKCGRYMAALVKGVKVGPSPDWLKEAMESVGQRSINNVVDAMNFVMLDIGQPLHAFDAAKLGQKDGAYALSVRAAKAGEKITVLTGEEFSLSEGMQLIVDGHTDAPLAIAGIKGGLSAAVTEATTDLIIESANFDGTTVRRAAQALKLFTDASLRFQNRPSPELCAYGISSALRCVEKVAGGTLAGVVDVYPNPVKPYKTGVSVEEVNERLGSKFSKTHIEDVLRRLALPYEIIANPLKHILTEAMKHEGAPYKSGASVLREAPALFDCSSLTSWLFAQAGIRTPRMSIDQYVWGMPIEQNDLQAGDLIFFNTGEGKIWMESQEYLPGTKVPEGVDHVALYLGEGRMVQAHGGDDQKVVIGPADAYSGKWKSIGYRRARGIEHERFVVTVPFERMDLRIKEDLTEEVGRILGYDQVASVEFSAPETQPDQARFRGIERMKDSLIEQGFTEISTQSFAKKGDIQLANPLDQKKPYLRTTLEENLKDALVQAKHYAPLVLPPNQKPKLFEVGTVFPKEGEFMELRMTEPAWDGVPTYDNLTVAKLEDYGKEYVPVQSLLGAYQPFSVYPFVVRDVAFWAPATYFPDTLEALMRKEGGEILLTITQFDQFEKDGRISVAWRLVFQSFERTLTDEEVNAIMSRITAALTGAGYEVR